MTNNQSKMIIFLLVIIAATLLYFAFSDFGEEKAEEARETQGKVKIENEEENNFEKALEKAYDRPTSDFYKVNGASDK